MFTEYLLLKLYNVNRFYLFSLKALIKGIYDAAANSYHDYINFILYNIFPFISTKKFFINLITYYNMRTQKKKIMFHDF